MMISLFESLYQGRFFSGLGGLSGSVSFDRVSRVMARGGEGRRLLQPRILG